MKICVIKLQKLLKKLNFTNFPLQLNATQSFLKMVFRKYIFTEIPKSLLDSKVNTVTSRNKQYCQLVRNFANRPKFDLKVRRRFWKFRPRNFGQNWPKMAEILVKVEFLPKMDEILSKNGRNDRNFTLKVAFKRTWKFSKNFLNFFSKKSVKIWKNCHLKTQ